MKDGQNSAPSSRHAREYYGKLGTVPQMFRFYRRYAFRVGQDVWWRDPSHGSKWHRGRVTNREPLRIDQR